MKNILVTGGAGFIGSHTVVELIKNGFRPIIVDDFSNSNKSSIEGIEKISGQKVALYQKNYRDQRSLKTIIKNEKIDGVIHFAAFKAVNESLEKPLKYYENNVAGLVTLLKVMTECSVNNIVFSSSCTVYGEPDNLPINEDAPLKPSASPYGTSKQMCEQILKDACVSNKDLNAFALRYFNPIGAHPSSLIGELPIGRPSNLVPFLTQTVAGKFDKIVVHGDDYPTPDGTCLRDYIHVVDLANAHVKALEKLSRQKSPNYDVFNIGTGAGNSVMEVLTTFEKVTSKNVPYEIGPRRSGDIISTYANADKAKKELGWEAKLSLGDALLDAWNWQESISK